MNQVWKKAEQDIVIRGDKMNIIESCVDRHAVSQPDKLAFVFQDEKNKKIKYTYKQLQSAANKFSNYLNKLGVKENSRVFIFLPKVPELYISFIGTIKQGSIVCPLFEAFQEQGLELRLDKGDADVLITNKELFRRLKHKRKTMKIIIIDSSEFKKEINKQSAEFKTVLKNKKDPALMMFTSSTAGTPIAGILLPHQALIHQHYTAKLVLALEPETKYWCTAHPGWVTGSVYGIIAPLSLGCTNYILETHFKANIWIKFLKQCKISTLYTAPTALRMLKPEVKKQDLTELKNLCSIGEALTKSTFDFYKKLGIEINDTYWQTETGAMIIATWPGLKRKKRAMGKAIPGITATIKHGTISLKPPWPAMMTGIYKHEKMYKSYFKQGWFETNDSAVLDKEGYFFFIARKDDIIKTSGERVSPIEVESVLEKHPAVHEAAVIGIPHEIKGQILKAFIVLNKGKEPTERLKQELSMFVKKNYAGHSYPKEVEFIEKLPKTNSGKIIRMKLRGRNL